MPEPPSPVIACAPLNAMATPAAVKANGSAREFESNDIGYCIDGLPLSLESARFAVDMTF
jgi:hypothetical protein